MPVHLTEYVKLWLLKLAAKINSEPVVVGGLLLAVADAVAESPSLKAAVPVVVSLLVRRFTSRAVKPAA